MSTLQIDFGHAEPRIVGIDLGTTNSLVAVMDLTGPRILSGIVPSVVAIRSLPLSPEMWKRVAIPRTSDHPSCCFTPPNPLENLTDTLTGFPLKCSAMQ